MPPGADNAVFDAVWPQVLAHLRKHEPEFILLQAGADSVEGDPITHMRFSRRGARTCGARSRACWPKSSAMDACWEPGGGGYNRINLARAWSGVVQGLTGAGRQ